MPILDKLNKTIGEITVESGALTPEQRNQALEVQARALAIYNAAPDQTETAAFLKKRETLPALSDDTKWDAISKERGVNAAALDAARATVQAGSGVPQAVPPLGQTANDLGFISQEVKNALLEAQAGARAHGLLDGNKTLQAFPPRATDPDFLQKAQQLAVDSNNPDPKLVL